jgi:hypothetical protein
VGRMIKDSFRRLSGSGEYLRVTAKAYRQIAE